MLNAIVLLSRGTITSPPKVRRVVGIPCQFFIERTNRGENQALVAAIPFCGEHPGPQFEDKFRSANQMGGISKAGENKMVAS